MLIHRLMLPTTIFPMNIFDNPLGRIKGGFLSHEFSRYCRDRGSRDGSYTARRF